MATAFATSGSRPQGFAGELARADRAIGGPRFDALLLWGAPLVALAAITVLGLAAAALPRPDGLALAAAISGAMAVVTYAHLIAVVPRAYLNREVFAANRLRLTLVPALAVAALAASPAVLVAGLVLAVFWDVHHSAMQTFGIGRIYDMKTGNDPLALRRIDLLLNAALYIGPAAAGASMIVHFNSFARFGGVGWSALTQVPGLVAGRAGAIHLAALVAWAGTVGAAAIAYARARAAGYTLSAHKAALLFSTAGVSILAWCLTPPFMAFAIVNLFHAMQYFAMVWLKEGGRIGALLPRAGRFALPLFLAACGGLGLLYAIAAAAGPARAGALLAPFVACSLLHFWFDAFVWSVRKRQV